MSDQRQAIPPALPQASATPGYVSSFDQIVFRAFVGIDTKSPRPAIDDRQMYWCDGWMPVGPSYLRILPGVGPPIYTAPAGTTVIWHQYGVIGSSPNPGDPSTGVGPRYYGVVLLSNGSVQAFNTDTGEVRQVMPPGAILNPRTQFGFSQWGSDYFLFCKDQPNGYWGWDEHNLFTSGTFSPIIDITDGGKNYSSPPNITVQTTGAGAGATFQGVLEPGGDSVAQIVVTNPGSGFGLNDFAILKFSGGGSDDTAVATCNLSAGGGVNQIIVTAGGSGYTFETQVVIAGGGGGNASATPNIQNGSIVSVTILNPGQDYTSAPSVSFNDPGYTGVTGGSGASAYAINGLNGVSAVTINYGGSGYTEIPSVEIIGDGNGALFRAQIAGGAVSEIQLVNPGQGYTAALPLITGGNNAAAADNWQTLLFPFGNSGTTVEVYQSRMWMANGAALADFPPRGRLIYSAPGNPFDMSLGAGSTLATDSFLKVGWFCLKQSNGFLYLIGDSSVNSISNVDTTTQGQQAATATTPANPGTTTTTFANQNTDPQAGSPWPSSVATLNRTIIFGNSNGIQVCYGGAVQKASGVLDGIFGPDVPGLRGNPRQPEIFGRQADFSSAVAQVFGIEVYCLLIPHLNLWTGNIDTTMIMYDQQKFWTSPQDVQLTYIASQEVLSQMIAWGTDGTNVFRLFQNPTANFEKVVRSKYWDNPGYDFVKTGVRLYGIFQDFPIDQPVRVDIENSNTSGGSIPTDPGSPGFGGSYNPAMPITGGGEFYTISINPTDPGMQTNATAVWGPYPAGQQGRLIGLTLRTDATQGNLVSLLLRKQDFELLE